MAVARCLCGGYRPTGLMPKPGGAPSQQHSGGFWRPCRAWSALTSPTGVLLVVRGGRIRLEDPCRLDSGEMASAVRSAALIGIRTGGASVNGQETRAEVRACGSIVKVQSGRAQDSALLLRLYCPAHGLGVENKLSGRARQQCAARRERLRE